MGAVPRKVRARCGAGIYIPQLNRESCRMTLPHSVLGARIAPRIGFAPTRQTGRKIGYHIPSARQINRAYAGWRNRLSLTSAAYYEPAMMSGYNHGGRAA